jgi:hypothetical protein
MKITLSEVFKKDLMLVGFLLANGLGVYVAELLKANLVLSIICGGALNYILFRVKQELQNEGYREALK